MIYLVDILKKIYPRLTWIRKVQEKVVYLTFDDGPIPEVTPWVLDLLKAQKIQATFFCIGDNIRKHPEVFQRIVADGHAIGNHTFNHLNGWKHTTDEYLENLITCENYITAYCTGTPKLFRPPYGKITRKQIHAIHSKGYEIVMWHTLTKDYHPEVTPEKCLKNGYRNLKSGSIIVFHDSLKAEKNLKYALPKLIKILQEKGYRFDTL